MVGCAGRKTRPFVKVGPSNLTSELIERLGRIVGLVIDGAKEAVETASGGLPEEVVVAGGPGEGGELSPLGTESGSFGTVSDCSPSFVASFFWFIQNLRPHSRKAQSSSGEAVQDVSWAFSRHMNTGLCHLAAIQDGHLRLCNIWHKAQLWLPWNTSMICCTAAPLVFDHDHQTCHTVTV